MFFGQGRHKRVYFTAALMGNAAKLLRPTSVPALVVPLSMSALLFYTKITALSGRDGAAETCTFPLPYKLQHRRAMKLR